MQTADPNIISISGRLSYQHIFEPAAMDEKSDKKYSATILMDKKINAASIKAVEAAAERVIKDKWKKRPEDVKVCLRDGNDKKGKEGYGPDIMFTSTSRKPEEGRPTVVDRDKTPLTMQDGKPYNGCYVNASIRLWPQDNKYGKRVNAELRAIQFVKDGEPFGGGTPVDAESELPDVDTVEV